MKIAPLSVMLVTLALSGCGGDHSNSAGGLFGVVRANDPGPCTHPGCSHPAPGVTLVFSRAGSVAARAKTDDHGRYRVALPPGEYVIPAGIRPPPTIEPTSVRVEAGSYRRQDFFENTGAL